MSLPRLLLTTLASASMFLLSSQGAEPLPAFSPECRILFQGDSIADGNRGRTADPNHILGHGYAFIIAAKHGAAFPSHNLTFLNRGISGNKVSDLAARWQKDTLDLKPDLLSILIGVNDDGRDVPMAEYEAGYDKLLTETKAAFPSVKLVLGEPFLLPVSKKKENWEAAKASIEQRQAIVAQLAAKHGAALVKYQQAFDDACKRAPANYWIWDGVHPTYAGHQVMADAWEATVRAFWK
ncbi:SGNH/GDSL hydrolase family protein [Verrucomicrobium sp. BvORR106]|uniref:SGNH/GDSL hydrolase family protein n=1 Tax=Verrucomicrobium sp. BvORR106 TaxID=1403819 RepID=UPI0009E00C2A|nr:SGNH/GDSL hydrolase family protein [Verrucomicrobium sp. BvORR106]